MGRHIDFISAGTVEVISRDGKTVLATLTEGDFFSEIALLLHRPRSASVRAVDFCDLYSLDKATFERILAFFPELLRSHSSGGPAEAAGALNTEYVSCLRLPHTFRELLAQSGRCRSPTATLPGVRACCDFELC